MGAGQSASQANSRPDLAATKTCYYELLGVERNASDTDIKKAYRRKALELHPDRNFGDAVAATQKFSELQSAYEILSDPHERSWYDSHRDTILHGQDITGDGTESASFRNIRITSTEEIMNLIGKFNTSIPFNDEPIGFFGVARETFEHLALEEEAAAEQDDVDVLDYPTFGQADDKYEDIVKQFYAAWAGFATKKSFAWKDKYRLSDAPDRRVRRLMEKENKKLREDAIREFNDAVKFLVTFVRKRDPRYIPSTKTEAERRKTSRVAAAAQAARSRVANQERLASYQLPEWVMSREDRSEEGEFPLSEVESEIEIIECVVCDKTFKSEKQLDAHERSKKHIKAVQQLRWQMRKDGVELQLDDNISHPEENHNTSQLQDTEHSAKSTDAEQITPSSPVSSDSINPETQSPPSSDLSEAGDDYAPMSSVLNRITGSHLDEPVSSPLLDEHRADDLSARTSSMSVDGEHPPKRKVGKAKAKRERKIAAAQANSDATQHRCTVCAEQFDSRTKLFTHVRSEGHASAPQVQKNKGGRNKRS